MADGFLHFNTKLNPEGVELGLKKLKGMFLKLGVGALITKIGKDMSSMGIGFNAQIQEYQTNFEVMTGSADKAAKHVRELKEMGARTPFELSDLASASQTLQAFGTNVDDVHGSLGMLGDISLGNKERFNSLALVYGQVRSQGKLMGQDLLQMINAGFNPLQVISEKTGESMSSLKDKMAKGQITFEMVEEAMKTATSEGGRFYQGMEKASKTFRGQMSTLKDTINEFLGAFTQPAFNWLAETVLPKAIKAMEWMKNHADLVRIALLAVAASITTGFAIAKFQKIKTGIQLVGRAMKTFIATNPMLLLAAALVGATVAIAGFIKGGGDITKLGNKIRDFVKKLPKIIKKISKELPKILKELIGAISEALPDIIKAGVEILLALIQGFIDAIPDLVAVIPSIIVALTSGLLENLPAIIEAGITILLAVIAGLFDALPQLVEAAPKILWALLKAMGALIGKFLELGVQLLSALWDGIASLVGWVIGKVVEFGRGVWNGIKEGLGSLYDIGANLIKGLWNGIKSMGKWIWNKIKGFCSDIWDGIKGFFGINSPSRLMKQAGKWIGEGLGLGIEASTDGVLDEVNKQTSAIKEAYSALDDISFEPSVRGRFKVASASSKWLGFGNSQSASNNSTVNQTFNFYEPHKTPNDTARLIRKEAVVLGLAGSSI